MRLPEVPFLIRPMLYLIDGYNLLNVADVPVPVRGAANLEKAGWRC